MSAPLPAPHRIVVGANLHAEISAHIHAARPGLQVRGAKFTEITDSDLAWAEAYIGFKRPPSVKSMGNVRWVHCTGAGVDSWLEPTPLDPSILLTRTSESFGPMIAEWAVARIFAIQMQLPDLAKAQSESRWAPRDIARLAGTRALVVGAGDVGTHVARSLSAFGVRVTGVSRTGSANDPAFDAVHPIGKLADLVGGADWIVLTLPITPATHGLFSRAILSRCNGAVLLNAGRGATLDESALPEALDKGWLRAAALDVFEVEPLPTSSPLWTDPRVIVSPHISGITTAEGAATGFLECLVEIEAGRRPKWTVDRARGY